VAHAAHAPRMHQAKNTELQPRITSTVAAMQSNADEWREMRSRTASSVAVSGSSAERAQQDALAAE